MLFNSIEFILFLSIVFISYWVILNKSRKYQNLLILLSSYFFYGWWDYRFLSLIFLSTVVDYFVGLNLPKQGLKKKQNLLLSCSVLFNLSLLGFFKYYNFFINSWIDLFNSVGLEIGSVWTLNIILPVGISFYTFQTMSYTIDIYNKKITPTRDFIAFASFVAFFPQLVAGPIERAANLLPQFSNVRKFDYNNTLDGLRQIIWGFAKKTLIADQCAESVNIIFNDSSSYQGSTLLIGAFLFSFQIYGDFSGYSDIAIGTARLFGFTLKKNFSYPYFSKNIEDFWRRWHISLSSWLRDYIYIPLFNKIDDHDIIDQTLVYKIQGIKITVITFLISGLWHGANWTFIFWGLFHAVLFIPSLIFNAKKQYTSSVIAQNKILLTLKELSQVGKTFIIVTIGWIFFRSESLTEAFNYLHNIFSKSLFTSPEIFPKITIIFIFTFIIVEWLGKSDEYAISSIVHLKKRYRWSVYLILCFLIFILSSDKTEFIYFQF